MSQKMHQMNVVNIPTAKNMMLAVIQNAINHGKAAANCNICLHGSPGVGKSNIVAQIAETIGAKLIDLRLSAMQESDVLGIPYVDTNGMMVFSTPKWWPDGSTPSILFLDELKSASQAVQTAAYRLILDRSIQNGSVLPNNCYIIGAGNLKEDKTGARDLLPAAANRFAMHLVIDSRPEALIEPFLVYATAKKLHRSIISFLDNNKDMIYGKMAESGDAYASPRTWEFVDSHLKNPLLAGASISNEEALEDAMAGREKASGEVDNSRVNPTKELFIAISSAVGSEASAKFRAYVEYEKDLPSWREVRAGKSNFKVQRDTDRSLQFSVACGLGMELLESCQERKDIAEGRGREGRTDEIVLREMVNLVELADQMESEMVFTMFRTMKRDMNLVMSFIREPAFKEFYNKHTAKMAKGR